MALGLHYWDAGGNIRALLTFVCLCLLAWPFPFPKAVAQEPSTHFEVNPTPPAPVEPSAQENIALPAAQSVDEILARQKAQKELNEQLKAAGQIFESQKYGRPVEQPRGYIDQHEYRASARARAEAEANRLVDEGAEKFLKALDLKAEPPLSEDQKKQFARKIIQYFGGSRWGHDLAMRLDLALELVDRLPAEIIEKILEEDLGLDRIRLSVVRAALEIKERKIRTLTLAEAFKLLQTYPESSFSETELRQKFLDAVMEQVVGYDKFSQLSLHHKLHILRTLGILVRHDPHSFPELSLLETMTKSLPAEKYLALDKARANNSLADPIAGLAYLHFGNPSVPVNLVSWVRFLRGDRPPALPVELWELAQKLVPNLRFPQTSLKELRDYLQNVPLSPAEEKNLQQNFANLKAAGPWKAENEAWWKAAAALVPYLPEGTSDYRWTLLMLPDNELEVLRAFAAAIRSPYHENLVSAARLRKPTVPENKDTRLVGMVTEHAIALHPDLGTVKMISETFHTSPFALAEKTEAIRDLLPLAGATKAEILASKLEIAAAWEEYLAEITARRTNRELELIRANLSRYQSGDLGLKGNLLTAISLTLQYRNNPNLVVSNTVGGSGVTSVRMLGHIKRADSSEKMIQKNLEAEVTIEDGKISRPASTTIFINFSNGELYSRIAEKLAGGEYETAVRLAKVVGILNSERFDEARAGLLRENSSKRIQLPNLIIRGIPLRSVP